MNLLQALGDGLRAAVGVPAIAYALAAMGLNLQFSYGGLANVGQVGFLLLGAYGTAMGADAGLPLPIAVLAGVAAAVGLGLLLGLATRRVRGDHLAIVTLAAAEILRLLVRSEAFASSTGGIGGIQGFADGFFRLDPIPVGRYGLGSLAFDQRTLWIVAVGWATVALAALVLWRLVASPWGRGLRAVRDDEDAARSLGARVDATKVEALVIGGVLGALGGVVLALDADYVGPNVWVLSLTTYAFVAVVLGGRETIIGPIVGSMAFWFLFQASDTLLRQALADPFWGDGSVTSAGPIRLVVVGIVLMVLMARRPAGLVGSRRQGAGG